MNQLKVGTEDPVVEDRAAVVENPAVVQDHPEVDVPTVGEAYVKTCTSYCEEELLAGGRLVQKFESSLDHNLWTIREWSQPSSQLSAEAGLSVLGLGSVGEEFLAPTVEY